MVPSIGRIVHYRLPRAYGEAWRPAIITQVFESGAYASGYGSNLTVFLDGANDLRYPEQAVALGEQGLVIEGGATCAAGYVTSAEEGTVPGCWRWPPRV